MHGAYLLSVDNTYTAVLKAKHCPLFRYHDAKASRSIIPFIAGAITPLGLSVPIFQTLSAVQCGVWPEDYEKVLSPAMYFVWT